MPRHGSLGIVVVEHFVYLRAMVVGYLEGLYPMDLHALV